MFRSCDLNKPDDDQKPILLAISRAAREIMPKPGERFRAIPLDAGAFVRSEAPISPGYLPLEEQ